MRLLEVSCLISIVLATVAAGCVERNPLRPVAQTCPACLSGISLVVDYPLDISPDGTMLLFAHRGSMAYPSGVYQVPINGGSPPESIMPLVVFSFDPANVRYSPDAGSVVFTRGSAPDVWVRTLLTGQERRLTFTNGNAVDPDWDPSGQFVVYSRSFLSTGAPDSSAGIHSVNVQTLEDHALRAQGQVVFGARPRWSEDSTNVAFWRGVQTGPGAALARVFVARVDGGPLVQLPGNPNRHEMYPEWIEGGQRILFESFDATTQLIHETEVVPASGGSSSPWPVDLFFPRSVISRDGKLAAYVGADPTGVYGVVHIRGAADHDGATDRQVTSFTLP
jgi:Tol biopolymer transport system component